MASGDATPREGRSAAGKAAKAQQLACCLGDLAKCEFVAVDLEFTGLFREIPPKRQAMEIYYEACSESVPLFLTVQLGVCPCWRREEEPDRWTLSPYNFFVFPTTEKRIFSVDSQTMLWLHSHGFNFASMLTSGYDYLPLAQVANWRLSSVNQDRAVLSGGVQRVVEEIIELEKPVVVHNGLLDLVHLHDKFIGSLPPTLGDFCAEILRMFSGGVFDTKHLANEGRYTILHIADGGCTALEALRNHLLREWAGGIKFQFPSARRESLQEAGYELLLEESPDASPPAHEAGFDALMTAQAFIVELGLFFRASKEAKSVKRRRKKAKDEESVQVGEEEHTEPKSDTASIPFGWKDSRPIRRFRDVVEVSGVPPGHLRLSAYVPARSDQDSDGDEGAAHPPPPLPENGDGPPPRRRRKKAKQRGFPGADGGEQLNACMHAPPG